MVADRRGIGIPERTVEALANFLARHADWLAAQEIAPEVTSEMAALVRQARAISDPHWRRRVRVGTCVQPGCPGHLTAMVRPQEATLPSEITCDRDPAHCWPADTWIRLSGQIGRPARATVWLTAADISRIWRTPVGSVYRLACEGEWRRRRAAGRTYYHEADVEQAFRLRR